MKSRKSEDALVLVGGALLGAAALYFLDPEAGRRRRQQVASAAEGVFDNARDRAKTLAARVGDHASSAQHHAAAYAQHLAGQAHDIASNLTAGAAGHLPSDPSDAIRAGSHWGEKWFGRARGAISDAHHAEHEYAAAAAKHAAGMAHDHLSHVHDVGNRLWNRARGLVAGIPDMAADHAQHLREELAHHSDPWRRQAARGLSRASHRAQSWLGHEEHRGFGTGTLLSSTVGCCAVGAGLMYFFDPRQGGVRRSWIAGKTMSCIHQTGQAMRGIGGDVSHWLGEIGIHLRSSRPNRSRSDSEQLLRRIRSEISHLSTRTNQVQFMTDADGTVTATGSIGSDELDELLTTLHRVSGVEHVINRLSVTAIGPSAGRGSSPAAAAIH